MSPKRTPRPGSTVRRPHRGPGAVDTLGIDIGGVIVDRVAEGSDTSFFGGRHLDTPAVPGAFDGLRALAGEFGGRVYLISKAGPKIAGKSREWLAHHDAFRRTSVPCDHLFFVRRRKDKADLCRRFNVTHFVDDRLEVLVHLDAVHHRYLFTGGLGHHAPPTAVPPAVQVAATWPRLVELVRAAREGSAG